MPHRRLMTTIKNRQAKKHMIDIHECEHACTHTYLHTVTITMTERVQTIIVIKLHEITMR